MAKKRGRRKKAPEVVNKHELPGGFWRQIGAVLMLALAVLLVVCWFGKGGVALDAIQSFLLKVLGFTTYLLPAILVYLAVLIFKAEDNRVDASVWVSSFLMIVWFSGVFGVASHQTATPHGGTLGYFLNNFLLSLVNSGVAVFIYVLLILITALFMYAETPAALFRRIGAIFRTAKTDEDVENAKVMRRSSRRAEANDGDETRDDGMSKFKVVTNVDIASSEDKKKGGLLKKPAIKPTMPEKTEPTALFGINDPNWKMPPLDLLSKKRSPADAGDTRRNAEIIHDTLEQFGISVEVEGANVGPRITQYTVHPPAGIKISKIATLDRELSLNLATDKIRIEAPIPGTRTVGIEIPNKKAAGVGLREMLSSSEWNKFASEKPMAFAVGKDISGQVIVGNLAKMPHLLIAGTTGSGKSVMTNTLLMSLLYHNSPSDLRLIIVDPKQVEMAAYNDIPHLLSPVITDTKETLSALKWAVDEMEHRYSVMAEARTKKIEDYNAKVERENQTVTMNDEDGTPQKHDGGKLPYIVIVVDEMSDLMMQAGKELEFLIVRIAQKGRAAGMHLVLATQRPEVKVVTGLIKANVPGRIAFAVNNNTDSRVMLDMGGAEKLLGSGDMLYLTTEMMGKPKRVQGAFVDDDEIAAVTNYLRDQAPTQYVDDILTQVVNLKGAIGGSAFAEDIGSGGGDLKRQAAEVGLQAGKMSTTLVQRKLKIGFGRASEVIEELEELGIVTPSPGGSKPRGMLISSMDEYDERVGQE